jgi:hypothetical protein
MKKFTVKAYQAHIGIIDESGNQVANIVDQGTVRETLRVAFLLAGQGDAEALDMARTIGQDVYYGYER